MNPIDFIDRAADKAADWIYYTLVAAVTAAFGWVFHVERRMSALRLHVAEHYVKKTDMTALEQRIANEFKEVKQGNEQILNILLQEKIGGRRR